ncbi:MAG: ferrous iron transport protein B [Oscillospiraceae bacterium]|nr:ferrous iron transport protein B [Oscillospiraceae bacterium]
MTPVIALAGNPNVGKSTVFNALTGLHQHTGNWSGKTVGTAEGRFRRGKKEIRLVDLPGAYSLTADSAEEEVARDFLCFEHPDAAVVICDACCLERNLIFAIQVAQIIPKTMLCVNMMDEARHRGIKIDLDALSKETGIPAVGVSAARYEGLDELEENMIKLVEGRLHTVFIPVRYPKAIENAAESLAPVLARKYGIKAVFPVIKLIENEHGFVSAFERRFGEIASDPELTGAIGKAARIMRDGGITKKNVSDRVAACAVLRAEEICLSAVDASEQKAVRRDGKIDSVLTGGIWGIPVMLLLFAGIFWITVSGANYPSQWIASGFAIAEEWLCKGLSAINAPPVLADIIVNGVWRVLSWVVSVMLPPMAIFFPLFTLLEDLGYLPRVAFNLDRSFKAAGACGKQALTMCMGLGCGAVGVTGARIIDSPRERLIAIITNCFVPCNGRFPAIIAIVSMFLTSDSRFSSLISALIMTGAISLSVLMTLVVSRILSKTVLKGVPAGFTLELPPYRIPRIGKVILRSVLDRTLVVLGRAVVVALPAGIIIWACSNINIGQETVLKTVATAIDPFARLFGMDGNVLFGFILALPANEIALPIMAMGYSGGALAEISSLETTAALFYANGFGTVNAICTLVFILFHWPCATTILTIWKETKSIKWTVLSVIVPLLTGLSLCFFINIASKLFI